MSLPRDPYERPEQGLGASLAEVEQMCTETRTLLFHQLGNIATAYGDEEVLVAEDMPMVRKQLEALGGWVIELGASPEDVIVAGRDVNVSVAETLRLAGYNRQTNERRRFQLQQDGHIAMVARKPLLASDVAAMCYIQRDIEFGAGEISANKTQQNNSDPRRIREKRIGNELVLNETTQKIVKHLFTPREELSKKLDLTVKKIGINLSRAVRGHDMTERQFFIAAFEQGMVEVPDTNTIPSTKSIDFSEAEEHLFDTLPLPRIKGKLTLGRWSTTKDELSKLYAKIGVTTPEQIFFILLRDNRLTRAEAETEAKKAA